MTSLTIVGGGIGGLTAAIAAAEHGVGVTLYEAKDRLGGRAWTTDGDFKANWELAQPSSSDDRRDLTTPIVGPDATVMR
jgi:predicted NAD/FAD-binding protein